MAHSNGRRCRSTQPLSRERRHRQAFWLGHFGMLWLLVALELIAAGAASQSPRSDDRRRRRHLSTAIPTVYELKRAPSVHDHHRRLLRFRRNNQTHAQQEAWYAIQWFHSTRHLSRYEFVHRQTHGIDLQLHWNGSYPDDDQGRNDCNQNRAEREDSTFQSLSYRPTNATHRCLEGTGGQAKNPRAGHPTPSDGKSAASIYQSVPLSQGYGTHLANIWVGSPHPQRKTVIVDTGSHFTAFPCLGCHHCGGSYHTDPYFDPQKSSTFHQLRCDECIGVICETGQCRFSQSYTEGSSWDAIQVRDRLYCGGKDVLDAVEPKDQKYAIDFMFGCMSKVNGLFLTQLADGIMGMSAHEATITKQLWNKGILEYNMFALCFRREFGTSKRGVAAGSMTLGGVTTNLDSSPLVYAKNMAKNGWFTVYVKNIYVRAGGGQSAATTPNTRTVRVKVDMTALNSGKGVIVDSGTTDTYLNKAVAPAFRRAWKVATGGKPYSHFPMRLTDEELARLPTVLVQCHSYTAPDPAVDDYGAIPGYAGQLDPSSPNDLLIAIPATSYMDYSPITKMYTSRLYLTETNGGVLGSNTMQGHNVVFDWRLGRIGFSESSCTYDKDDLPPEQADEDGYPADCVVNQPILTSSCVETVDKSLCGFVTNNTMLLGQQKWTALVESPGASHGLTCQETAAGSRKKKATDDEAAPDEDYVECRGDGTCEEGKLCQLSCREIERASTITAKPRDNERLGCGDSYWSACDRACRQTRLQSTAYSDGFCHEVSRESRSCHTDACLREFPCLVPYTIHLVLGFHGLSIRDWTFTADDAVAQALVETSKHFLGESPFSEGDISVVFSLPWYLDDDNPEAALHHKADKDIKPVGVKAVIDISIVNHAYNQTQPGIGSGALDSVFSNWTLFGENTIKCDEQDLHRLARVALSIKKEVLSQSEFVPTLIDMIVKAESITFAPGQGDSMYFSPVFSHPPHVKSSRLVATWSIPTGINEKINYYGPHRPIWYLLLRILHIATIFSMTIVLLWSIIGASSSLRELWLRLGWRWRLPRSPLSPYHWLRHQDDDAALDQSTTATDDEVVTLEMATHPQTSRSRNGTIALKRKANKSDAA